MGSDDCARVLLLAEHAGEACGSAARRWPPGAPTGPFPAVLGAFYRAGADQTPTAVHVAPGGPGPWLALVRRGVGPLAELTVHTIPAGSWITAVALAMTVLGTDPAAARTAAAPSVPTAKPTWPPDRTPRARSAAAA
ncbi:hypothetical protein AB0N09_42310 [Streptomyces erythrochromogenes]|uniref:hypothetical protein n=1 Tax=Streptomyces erythrochromogenes TaxID=285574 RepID=UPI00341F2C63